MSPLQQTGSPVQHTVSIPGTITLDPLRSNGPDALATNSVPDLAKVTLRELKLAWDTELHPTVVKQADDLFACSGTQGVHGDLVPKGAKATEAILDFEFAGSREHHLVDLSPPNTISVLTSSYVERIRAWLAQSPFAAASKTAISHLLLAVALTLSSALPAAFDLDDDDDDDDDDDHCVLATEVTRWKLAPGPLFEI